MPYIAINPNVRLPLGKKVIYPTDNSLSVSSTDRWQENGRKASRPQYKSVDSTTHKKIGTAFVASLRGCVACFTSWRMAPHRASPIVCFRAGPDRFKAVMIISKFLSAGHGHLRGRRLARKGCQCFPGKPSCVSHRAGLFVVARKGCPNWQTAAARQMLGCCRVITGASVGPSQDDLLPVVQSGDGETWSARFVLYAFHGCSRN